MEQKTNSLTTNQLLTKEYLQEFQKSLLKQLKEMLPQLPENECWLKTAEVCKMLKISPNSLLAMRHKKTIAFTRIGRNVYYKHSDLEKYLLNNYKQQNNK
jgi:excisionase family DNA binding protein